MNRVPVTIVGVDGYRIEEKLCSGLDTVFTETQVDDFTKEDITLADVERCYKYLLQMPLHPFLCISSAADQMNILREVMKSCVRCAKAPFSHAADPEKQVFLVFDTLSPIMYTVSHIMGQLFPMHGWTCRLMENLDITFSGHYSKGVAVTLISASFSQNPYCGGALCAVSKIGFPVVSLLSEEAFSKPTADWFNRCRNGLVFGPEDMDVILQMAPEATCVTVAEALEALFMIIAWRLTTTGSHSVMKKEFENLVIRVSESKTSYNNSGLCGSKVCRRKWRTRPRLSRTGRRRPKSDHNLLWAYAAFGMRLVN